jgi:hypothetical protein
MEPDVEGRKLRYVIPARTISGTAQEILAELDDMVDALQLVRTAIVERTPKPAWQPRRNWLVAAWRAFQHRRHEASSANRYPTQGSVSR